jgi:UDP-N-acetyl-D-glucosamine dehydrogenase
MLKQLIEQRQAAIGIIGMGYVGLPLAMEFAKQNFRVTGFEIDSAKAGALNKGVSHILDVPSESVGEMVRSKNFSATNEFKKLARMDVIIICVPTPLRKTKDPDISYIVSAVDKIVPCLKKGQLIVLESTTYPGTTRELLLPELEKKKMKAGRDFYLAFSPERVDPGNKKFSIKNTPKVVGGMTPECTRLASVLYGTIVERVVEVSSTECAEMVKLLENTFRAVNIALVNEVTLMCDRLKLDAWEIIDAAATKPFGFMPFYPGPGIGGHCIPLDPQYLSWKLKSLNFYSRFIELAGEVNSTMPDHVVKKVDAALNGRKKSIKGSRILIVGVAYKKDVGDMRESPALDVIELLSKKDAVISYHDPYVPLFRSGEHRYKSVALTPALLRKQDCVVLTTNHSCFNIKYIAAHSKLIVDTRNMTKGMRTPNIVKL